MVKPIQKCDKNQTAMRGAKFSCWRPLALAAMSLGLVPAALAQTVVIAPQTQNYWAGVNTSASLGVGSNQVTVASANGTTINFGITGQPAGLTTVSTQRSMA